MAEAESVEPREPRTGKKDGVPYKECIVLRGPERPGQLHAAHSDVCALYLKNPLEPKNRPTLWFRGHGDEMCDDEGHPVFIHECLVDADQHNIVPEMRRR